MEQDIEMRLLSELRRLDHRMRRYERRPMCWPSPSRAAMAALHAYLQVASSMLTLWTGPVWEEEMCSESTRRRLANLGEHIRDEIRQRCDLKKDEVERCEKELDEALEKLRYVIAKCV